MLCNHHSRASESDAEGCVGSRLWHVATKPCTAPCTMVSEPTVNYTVRRALALVHTAGKLRARPAPSLSSLTARTIETRALCAPTITPRSSRLSRTAEWVARGEERCDTTDRSCAGFSLSTTEHHRRSADRERSARTLYARLRRRLGGRSARRQQLVRYIIAITWLCGRGFFIFSRFFMIKSYPRKYALRSSARLVLYLKNSPSSSSMIICR